MKAKITLVSVSAFLFILFFAGGYDKEDGRAGNTGSPGETTCSTTSCHTGTADNSQGGSVTITSNIPDWEYVPGSTYIISVTVAQAGRPLFGLGVEALLPSGANGGNLVPGTGTQIKTKTISGNVRKNIVHLEDAGLTNDSHTFEFTWEAPATNVGEITFYVAGNAANNNGLKTGDFIYTTTHVASDGSVGVKENNQTPVLEVFCNPSLQTLNMNYTLITAAKLEIKLYSIGGKEVALLMNENIEAGQLQRTFSIADIKHGSYLVSVSLNGSPAHFEKFVY
ncbi:MAG: choice-of-anchor V domain-containing protein [Flavobacteriales bacterium]|nr:choice-of-anchor V domain-containing protein [Flavobacteriales bacterium]